MKHAAFVRRTSFTQAAATIGAIIGLVACSDGHSPPPSPGDHGEEGQLDAASIAEIERRADDAIAAGIPGLSLSVIRGKQVMSLARGVADRATGEGITTEDHLRMASLAKSFTASIVLQLVKEERLRLDDTIERWLPGALPGSGGATLERLLRQESGIFDFSADDRYVSNLMQGDLGHAYTPEELVIYAASHEPLFPPGERFMYSNTNFVVLALIAEKATGQELADLVEQRITGPLGLQHTTLVTSAEMPQPFAHGYLLGLGDPIDATGLSGSAVYGCGNLVSTPLDMAKFYGALARGEVVSNELLPTMFDPTATIETRYGMGVWRMNHEPNFISCGDFVGHEGGIPGYDTVAYSSTDAKRQFALTVTSFTLDERAGDDTAHAAYKSLIEAIACE